MARSHEKRIVGRYMLHGEIASGGMATVYFGRLMGEAGFSRVVAVKCLHPQFARDAEFRAMFLDEARVCARIRHPNVVSILDVVGLEGELFLVMEYVQGETLSRLLRTARQTAARIPTEMSASIMTGVLDGLHAAHEACSERGEPLGIVHRDVSPQNIIVGVDGAARVVDFGVAKATGRLQTTRDGQLKGKLSYMAPEQLRGEAVDRRTDVYAASVVFWEALTGKRLFDGEQEAAVFGQVLEAEIVPPSRHAPDVSPALDAVVLRGLSRDPAGRYPTALDMAVAIEGALSLAPARQVGQRVLLMAEGALQRRAENFAEIESVSSVNLMPPPAAGGIPAAHASSPSLHTDPSRLSHPSHPSHASHPGALTAPSMTHGADPRSVSQLTNLSMAGQGRGSLAPRSRAGLIAALAGAAIFGAVLAVVFVAFRPAPPKEEPSAATRASEPAASVPIHPVAEAPSASSAPEPVASAAEPVKSASPSEAAKAKVATKHGPVAAPAGEPKSPPTKGNAADCNPPYTLDSKGTRIPKLQCL